ncbi:hypothetical protein [Salinispora arenicola]
MTPLPSTRRRLAHRCQRPAPVCLLTVDGRVVVSDCGGMRLSVLS